MTDNDAFDLWWEWAEKPVDSDLTIRAATHAAVIALPPDERRDRDKVNDATIGRLCSIARHHVQAGALPNSQSPVGA